MTVLRIRNLLFRRSLVRRGAKIGRSVVLHPGSVIGDPANLIIGEACYFEKGFRLRVNSFEGRTGVVSFGKGVYVNTFSFIDCLGSISIGDYTLIGPHVYIGDFEHALQPTGIREKRPLTTPGSVQIGENVWIGAGSQILKGTVIGDNAVIGAGSVVRGVIPPNVVAVGVPARVVKHIHPTL